MQGDHDATIELDGKNELKSGSYNAGLEKNGHESEGTLTIKDDKGKDGSLTAEGGDGGGAGIGGGKESTGSNITIRGGTVEAVGGSSAAGIGDGAYRASDDTDDPNPGKLYICGDAEVTAKAGSQILDAKVPAIGGTYGEVPTESLSDADHKVTGGRLTRYGPDGTVMEGWATTTPPPLRPSRRRTRTTRMMTSRPRHRRMPPNPCPAAWWSRASSPAGSPSSSWTFRGSRKAASAPWSAA